MYKMTFQLSDCLQASMKRSNFKTAFCWLMFHK